jgi:hypothetical protein
LPAYSIANHFDETTDSRVGLMLQFGKTSLDKLGELRAAWRVVAAFAEFGDRLRWLPLTSQGDAEVLVGLLVVGLVLDRRTVEAHRWQVCPSRRKQKRPRPSESHNDLRQIVRT